MTLKDALERFYITGEIGALAHRVYGDKVNLAPKPSWWKRLLRRIGL